MYRIGCDVGGTYTDCAILKELKLTAFHKHPTTTNVSNGLIGAIRGALFKFEEEHGALQKSDVNAVMIGTTHFINAVVQRTNLEKVAVIRLCSNSSRSVPPFLPFPDDLSTAVNGGFHFLSGGFEYDGKEIGRLCEIELRQTAAAIRKSTVRAIAVVGVFSPMNCEQERQAERILLEEIPDALITKSSDVGKMGFLERENATILNAALRKLARRTVEGLRTALAEIGLGCPFYFSHNDGTLLTAERLIDFPIFTFASGPTNSVRGAYVLTNEADAIVVDIGGTTTDVGVLEKGFPRLKGVTAEIEGIKTNFNIPNVLSVGLGGGSIVNLDDNKRVASIGPTSVGYNILSQAKIYGGNVLTATDIVAAMGHVQLGTPELVADLPEELLISAENKMKEIVENAIDAMKLSPEPVKAILVGGGSCLLSGVQQLEGVSEFFIPDGALVANAVGAALAQISGVVDRLVHLDKNSREGIITGIVEEAKELAVCYGAEPSSLSVQSLEEIPIAYGGGCERVVVKVTGNLSEGKKIGVEDEPENDITIRMPPDATCIGVSDSPVAASSTVLPQKSPSIISTYDAEGQQRRGYEFSEYDLSCISLGASVAGAGGGGSPYTNKLRALSLYRRGHRARMITPEELNDNDVCLMVAFVGAPTIMSEKLPGQEILTAIRAVERTLGTQIAALLPAEVGGANSLEPIIAAAQMNIPVVDVDGMGRAFPELQMLTFFIEGLHANGAAVSDEKGNTVVFSNVLSPSWLERIVRANVIELGGFLGLALPPISGRQIKDWGVKHSLSHAWRLGNAILSARRQKMDAVTAIFNAWDGKVVFKGKVISLTRSNEGGFTRGIVTIEGAKSSPEYVSKTVTIEFQNENVIAKQQTEDGEDKVLCVVPDIICIMESDTGEPITTEHVRYGLQVTICVLASATELRTAKALQVIGPAAFGYGNVIFEPFGHFPNEPSLARTKKD